MDGELDPFDFTLAKQLGMTVAAMRAVMGNDEYLAWKAYFVWRREMEKLEKSG